MPLRLLAIIPALFIGCSAPADSTPQSDLASYFGFDGCEIIKVGRRAGPFLAADVNSDGLQDLIIVNNRASRIELQIQKQDAAPTDAQPPARLNEFPEHWRFRRVEVPVSHRVTAVVVHDFDQDGRQDLIYAGMPSEIVFLRQRSIESFEISRRHRVRDLSATRDGFFVDDFIGDDGPELLYLAGGNIHIAHMRGDELDEPIKLTAGDTIVAAMVDDMNGDGRTDVIGALPENAAPLRLWLGGSEDGNAVLGAQLRFEMPSLTEATPFRLPGERSAKLAIIERASKRLVIHQLTTEPIESAGSREVSYRVYSFTDPRNRQRAHAVFDLNGDGLPDLLTTDTEANAVVVYRQIPSVGFRSGTSYPSLKKTTYLAAGNVDDDATAEIFVLSEEESVVGRIDSSADGLPFPLPVKVSDGRTPTAMNIAHLERGPCLAVVAKESRDYVLELTDMQGGSEIIDIGKLSRSPDTLLPLDADQDGRTDLLLFTRDKPMIMLRAGEEGFELIESDTMGQYGLVKAATSENTAVFDVDGDGRNELLLADSNFVRAVRYEPEPATGISPGWQVVTQVNAADSSSKLVALATLNDQIVAADGENNRLIVMAEKDGGWKETEALSIRGFQFDAIHTGAFTGVDEPSILAIGDDGFAVIRLAGHRIALEEVTSWQSANDRTYIHELAVGDVNRDGFLDMIGLDAGEQMCEIFTFSESGRMLNAMGFEVFESRLFSGGEAREYQPSQAIVVDVTGDGANDLVLLTHDRILIYPQMTVPEE